MGKLTGKQASDSPLSKELHASTNFYAKLTLTKTLALYAIEVQILLFFSNCEKYVQKHVSKQAWIAIVLKSSFSVYLTTLLSFQIVKFIQIPTRVGQE